MKTSVVVESHQAELNMPSNQIICALCKKSDETEVTGPLSSKHNISAHQNCLLYASAIFCTNSPTYDDLFGFDVEDVKKELKRGKRLFCHYCKRAGATAGCDVKRCKRSYHYPCAIKDRARAAENSNEGSYKLFCALHVSESKKISPLKVSSPQKASGSSDHPEDLKDKSPHTFPYMYRRRLRVPRGTYNSTPDSKSDDESPTSADCVIVSGVSDPENSVLQKQPNQSSPVPKRKRLCEKLKPSPTEADDDTDVDSSQEESQSLLFSKRYRITMPCQVILDSGPSVESEHSLEPSSPASAAVSTSPEQKETASTSRSSPAPRAPTTEPVSPTIYSVPAVERFSCDSGRPAAAKASKVGTTEKPKSSASVFWTRCNEAGWTKEIFSELESQLSSLGERVQSQKASDQDYDAALKVLEASGRLPCIISQLEQDIEKQEQDLKRKKAALRDAKAVLDV
ncbi:uncharacterized protein LOC122351939 [Puntigrus tetrazona]|uniref:uncharacterized protein LOC122351939 n=1 Tax=Puntigrus tetrazona TaxID=1606681 RepID=UPI001C896983|nr:uncharacterized protein LOC122351939 [Puntigrus tetrazona]